MSLSEIEQNKLLCFANGLADTSRVLLQGAVSIKPRVEVKDDLSFVTQTDKEVELELRNMIEKEFPQHGILGEELGHKNLNAEFVCVLDPINGTAPFIENIPVYGSLIAFAWQGSPLLRIIEQPATNDRWAGIANKIAFHNGLPTKLRPCRFLKQALATCSNPGFMTKRQYLLFGKIKRLTRYVQYDGACFAYGSLASGNTDLAIDAVLKPYDLFAPAAIISGAVCIVIGWNGGLLKLDMTGEVVACGNQRIHDSALKILAGKESGQNIRQGELNL